MGYSLRWDTADVGRGTADVGRGTAYVVRGTADVGRVQLTLGGYC